jgi:hypothetical protein
MSTRRRESYEYAALAARRRAAIQASPKNLFGSVPVNRYRTPLRVKNRNYRKPFYRQKKFTERRMKTLQDKIIVDRDGQCKVINSISQGTSSDQRLGHDILITGISIQGKTYIATADDYTGLHVLWFLILDKKPKGTSGELINVSDIFKLHDNEPFTAMVREDMTDRYRVIKKGVHLIS